MLWIIFIGLFLFAGIINVINWEVVNSFIGGILSKIGNAIAPYLNALPDSFAVPVIALIALCLLYILIRPWSSGEESFPIEAFFKLTMAWCSAALNLGMITAAAKHPHGSLSFVISGFAKQPLTLYNFPQWGEQAQVMLYLIVIGGLIISLLFAVLRGPRSFLRTWVGLAMCVMLGYVLMNVRLTVMYWVTDRFGLIGTVINVALTMLEVLLYLAFFFGIVIFVLPRGAIVAINEMNRENERRSRIRTIRQTASSAFDDVAAAVSAEAERPSYVTDEDGHRYAVEFDGDYLYIRSPYGRVGTKWEYVKGGSYFDLQGRRYYLH